MHRWIRKEGVLALFQRNWALFSKNLKSFLKISNFAKNWEKTNSNFLQAKKALHALKNCHKHPDLINKGIMTYCFSRRVIRISKGWIRMNWIWCCETRSFKNGENTTLTSLTYSKQNFMQHVFFSQNIYYLYPFWSNNLEKIITNTLVPVWERIVKRDNWPKTLKFKSV